MMDDLDTAALRAQLESLASLWQGTAEENRRGAVISDSGAYDMGYADGLDRASQALKGILDQWA
jgi:hypothetical protein